MYHLPATAEEDPYNVPDEQLRGHARAILDAGARHVLLSGGDEIQFRLMEQIKQLSPTTRCDLVWHGNYTHFDDGYTWRMLTQWIDAARDGAVHTIASVKEGMDDFLRRCGVRSHLLLNYIDREPLEPPRLDDDPAQVGIWISGSTPLKTPFPMLAAARLLPSVLVHAAGVGPHARRMVDYFGIETGLFSETPISKDDLEAAIRGTHLTMYVTFVECCPMLPLESMSLGVPCLVGPASHLFEEDEYLFERLVVPFPDRADVIARYAERAIAERTKIIDAYRGYAKSYNERARRSVQELLGAGQSVEAAAAAGVTGAGG